MKKNLLFIVGQRNIKYKGEYIDKSRLREITKEILDNYNKEKENLELQIFPPLLEEFKDETKKVFLFVTNQQDENFKETDTINAGVIAKYLIEEEYGLTVEIKYYEDDPSDLEVASEYFSRFLRNLQEELIVCNSGGMPQLKSALTFTAVNLLENVHIYEVNEYDKVCSTKHKKTIRQTILSEVIKNLISNYDYQSALRIMKENKMELKHDFFNLVSYAKHRVAFDFEMANKRLENFLEDMEAIEKKRWECFRIDMEKIEIKIKELYYNLLIKYHRGEYTDFAGRVFRLYEAYYYMLISEHLERDFCDQNKKEEELRKEFDEALEEKYMKDGLLNNGKISSNGEEVPFNTHVFYIILESVEEMKSEVRKLKRIKNFIENHRHKSILAHGFTPIKKEEVDNSKVLEELSDLMKVRILSDDFNPFDEINNYLLKQLQ